MLDNIRIGNQITCLRKRNKLTQDELAEKLGVSVQSISKWENGHSLPETTSLPLLAKLLNCSIDAILSPPIEHNANDCNYAQIVGGELGEKPCALYENHPFTKTKVCPCSVEDDVLAITLEIWEQTKKVKPFVDELERRRVKGKKIWYDENLDTIFIVKVFADECGGGCPENDSLIGRACHCNFYNHLKEFYPKYYCQCSAEYYRPMFEPIFGKEIECYPFKTVLSGNDECVIGIKLSGK